MPFSKLRIVSWTRGPEVYFVAKNLPGANGLRGTEGKVIKVKRGIISFTSTISNQKKGKRISIRN